MVSLAIQQNIFNTAPAGLLLAKHSSLNHIAPETIQTTATTLEAARHISVSLATHIKITKSMTYPARSLATLYILCKSSTPASGTTQKVLLEYSIQRWEMRC
jgi:hypothetical protein